MKGPYRTPAPPKEPHEGRLRTALLRGAAAGAGVFVLTLLVLALSGLDRSHGCARACAEAGGAMAECEVFGDCVCVVDDALVRFDREWRRR